MCAALRNNCRENSSFDCADAAVVVMNPVRSYICFSRTDLNIPLAQGGQVRPTHTLQSISTGQQKVCAAGMN